MRCAVESRRPGTRPGSVTTTSKDARGGDQGGGGRCRDERCRYRAHIRRMEPSPLSERASAVTRLGFATFCRTLRGRAAKGHPTPQRSAPPLEKSEAGSDQGHRCGGDTDHRAPAEAKWWPIAERRPGVGVEDRCDNEQESESRQENVQTDRNPPSDPEPGQGDDRDRRRSARERQNQEAPALRPRRDGTALHRLEVARQSAHLALQTQESDADTVVEAEPRERRADGHAEGTEQAHTQSGDGR